MSFLAAILNCSEGTCQWSPVFKLTTLGVECHLNISGHGLAGMVVLG